MHEIFFGERTLCQLAGLVCLLLTERPEVAALVDTYFIAHLEQKGTYGHLTSGKRCSQNYTSRNGILDESPSRIVWYVSGSIK